MIRLAADNLLRLLVIDGNDAFEGNLAVLSNYIDELRVAAFEALDEEAILVVATKVYHSVT